MSKRVEKQYIWKIGYEYVQYVPFSLSSQHITKTLKDKMMPFSQMLVTFSRKMILREKNFFISLVFELYLGF